MAAGTSGCPGQGGPGEAPAAPSTRVQVRGPSSAPPSLLSGLCGTSPALGFNDFHYDRGYKQAECFPAPQEKRRVGHVQVTRGVSPQRGAGARRAPWVRARSGGSVLSPGHNRWGWEHVTVHVSVVQSLVPVLLLFICSI